MDLKTVILGAAAGAAVGALSKKKGAAMTYALWGGGAGLAFSFVRQRMGGEHMVGQLPQSLPTPGLPGQFTYNLDPRRDPLLDPVSRQRLYPAWLLAHWQNGDTSIIAQVQGMLGVPADGVIGGGTAAAIRSFQEHSGLPVTGTMTLMTMQALAGS
jgi:peptidoglycan hydrolase-like protein with peptidoglycan-binding domain